MAERLVFIKLFKNLKLIGEASSIIWDPRKDSDLPNLIVLKEDLVVESPIDICIIEHDIKVGMLTTFLFNCRFAYSYLGKDKSIPFTIGSKYE